ncbi:hypothetical protein NQZ68_013992 [Dissostichus eleginoides]|nr:hypothetical protein NQZ68_013992 [Dissostichus eleginoides]
MSLTLELRYTTPVVQSAAPAVMGGHDVKTIFHSVKLTETRFSLGLSHRIIRLGVMVLGDGRGTDVKTNELGYSLSHSQAFMGQRFERMGDRNSNDRRKKYHIARNKF